MLGSPSRRPAPSSMSSARPQGPRPKPTSPSRAQIQFGFPSHPYADPVATDIFYDAGVPPRSTMSRGTLLHKGFYDLLNMIPATTSNLGSRFPWGANTGDEILSNRYEDLGDHGGIDASPVQSPSRNVLQKARPTVAVVARPVIVPPLTPPKTPPTKKARRVSKDMISSPTGFVHLVHASDAEQAEELLRRWGPDGIGKIGDPSWALPIKDLLRNQAQARAVAQVVDAHREDEMLASQFPVAGIHDLHVMNGMSTLSSTTVSTMTQKPGFSRITGLSSPLGQESTSFFGRLNGTLPEIPGSAVEDLTETPGTIRVKNIPLQDVTITGPAAVTVEKVDALPSPSQISNPLSVSTSRGWLNSLGGLKLLDGRSVTSFDSAPLSHAAHSTLPTPVEESNDTTPSKPIQPSLMTLDRVVSCKIFFENLYFPLLRQPPPREQRRRALEADLIRLGDRMTDAAKNEVREQWRQNESDYLRDQRRKVGAEAFARVKVIGHGAFGVVSLVRERSTGQLYAMKQLRKTDMLRKGQEGHVRAEREVLKAASLVPSIGGPDWIVKLHYSFQDRDHLYLVLEFMGGGDLLNLLIERDTFDEDFARFYAAEMILAIEQCHKQGFIHRDIKPDNFLFDPEGHIKLSDFGLATDLHWAHDTSYYEQQRRDLLHKYGIDLDDGATSGATVRMKRKDVEKLMGGNEGDGGLFTWREKNRKKLAYSVCGTNSYMSPEVIRGHGYSFSCDWWSLGVIIFECLYGYPPFVSNSRHVTRQKILNWRQSLKFPSKPRVSHDGVNLMQQLLCEPEDRLGSQLSLSRPTYTAAQNRRSGFFPAYGSLDSVDGAEHIKAHPWFRGIDWGNLHQVQAPFRPELQDPADTRHFDDDIPSEPLAPANGAAADATRDPMLRDNKHGAEILDARKKLAFVGFTHKSPRVVTYPRVDAIYQASQPQRGRRDGSASTFGRSRAMSL